MLEGGMPGLWLLPESLEELRVTFKANKRPLETKALVPWFFMQNFPGYSISREGTRVAFLKDGKEELKTCWEPQGLEKYR